MKSYRCIINYLELSRLVVNASISDWINMAVTYENSDKPIKRLNTIKTIRRTGSTTKAYSWIRCIKIIKTVLIGLRIIKKKEFKASFLKLRLDLDISGNT